MSVLRLDRTRTTATPRPHGGEGGDMSGKGAKKRSHVTALLAASLKEQGLTTREIAIRVGKKPQQVAALVLLGQRLKVEI